LIAPDLLDEHVSNSSPMGKKRDKIGYFEGDVLLGRQTGSPFVHLKEKRAEHTKNKD